MKPNYHLVTWPEVIAASFLISAAQIAGMELYMELRVIPKLESIIESNLESQPTLDDRCIDTDKGNNFYR